jgi:hypothetical protein
MRPPRLLAALLTVPFVLLAAPSAGLAIDAPQIPLTLSPTAAKFKQTSTLKVSFAAPYNLGDSPVAETYRLDVFPPPRSKCRAAELYETAPDTVGDKLTIKVAPSKVKPKDKPARWCKGTYRIVLSFEDPTSTGLGGGPPPSDPDDESGPPDEVTPDGDGYGVDVFTLSERKLKVR